MALAAVALLLALTMADTMSTSVTLVRPDRPSVSHVSSGHSAYSWRRASGGETEDMGPALSLLAPRRKRYARAQLPPSRLPPPPPHLLAHERGLYEHARQDARARAQREPQQRQHLAGHRAALLAAARAVPFGHVLAHREQARHASRGLGQHRGRELVGGRAVGAGVQQRGRGAPRLRAVELRGDLQGCVHARAG